MGQTEGSVEDLHVYLLYHPQSLVGSVKELLSHKHLRGHWTLMHLFTNQLQIGGNDEQCA